jgi:hypothetical protein
VVAVAVVAVAVVNINATYASQPSETGFLPNLWAVKKYCRKKPGF